MDSGGSWGTEAAGTVLVGGIEVPADSKYAVIDAALDDLLAGPLRPLTPQAATAQTKVVEHLRRKTYAVHVESLNQLEASGVHREDGHSTATAHVRHHARLSGSEARASGQVARMIRALPLIREALFDGRLGIEQVQLLGRVYGNARVRDAMVIRQERFIDQAAKFDYRMFETRVREWERLVDQDGPEPANERTHRNRNARLTQSPIDLDWEFLGRFGALQGARISEIYGFYVDAERLADWEKARAEHGDLATKAHLPRTEAQRRADAFEQMCVDAASADGSAVPADFCHNINWDANTYEEMLRRMDGQDPQPLDPDTYRCETLDGVPLEPHEAAANSLLHGFRRIVTSAKSVTLDAGQKRLFTGVLKTVVRIQSGTTCVWPGCHCPVSRCETDHLTDHSRGGLTNPDSGAPLCGKHNRWKQKGFTVWRAPDGTWLTTRPDGTTIDP